MGFPYSYSKTLNFSTEEFKTKEINKNEINSLIYKTLKKRKAFKIETNKNIISFILKAPVLRFEYLTDIKITKANNQLDINYSVNFEKLLRIILILIILIAFFSFVSIKYFLIISGLISILFYGIMFLSIDNLIENIIKESLDEILVPVNSAEKFTEEQLSWINDKNRCSACGEILFEYNLHCPECGIKLKRNKYSIPFDSSKYQDKEVKYYLKKDK